MISNKMTEDEFNKKYDLYAQMIFNISYGYTHNKQDAEDIVQDVFLKYLNQDIFFANSLEEKYWLIRITINENISQSRKAYKKKVVLDDDMVGTIPDSQKKDDLIAEVMKLPVDYKNVIILYYYNNLSVKEIAETLKKSESAVKKKMERARKILKKMMEDN